MNFNQKLLKYIKKLNLSGLKRRELDPPKMLTHFGRAVNIRGRLFNVLRDKEVTGDPAGAKAPRRLQDLPAESKFPQRKSKGYNKKNNLYENSHEKLSYT
jgi:hypothetical protein